MISSSNLHYLELKIYYITFYLSVRPNFLSFDCKILHKNDG